MTDGRLRIIVICHTKLTLFVSDSSPQSANLGNLVLIVLPAVCQQDGSPFGDDHAACVSKGLSYGSFSMAVCKLPLLALQIWVPFLKIELSLGISLY